MWRSRKIRQASRFFKLEAGSGVRPFSGLVACISGKHFHVEKEIGCH